MASTSPITYLFLLGAGVILTFVGLFRLFERRPALFFEVDEGYNTLSVYDSKGTHATVAKKYFINGITDLQVFVQKETDKLDAIDLKYVSGFRILVKYQGSDETLFEVDNFKISESQRVQIHDFILSAKHKTGL
jgi:hypothetical protein